MKPNELDKVKKQAIMPVVCGLVYMCVCVWQLLETISHKWRLTYCRLFHVLAAQTHTHALTHTLLA